MEKKLRIAQVAVSVALVWDDGEELTPGPEVRPVTIPLSGVAAFIDAMPAEIARIEQEGNTAQDYQPGN